MCASVARRRLEQGKAAIIVHVFMFEGGSVMQRTMLTFRAPPGTCLTAEVRASNAICVMWRVQGKTEVLDAF